MLSQNCNLIEGDPIARKIFQRKNLVAGSKRGKNLHEFISFTVQKHGINTQIYGTTHLRCLTSVQIQKMDENVNYAYEGWGGLCGFQAY